MNVFELFALLKLNSSAYKKGLDEAESQGESSANKIQTTMGKIAAASAKALAAASAAVAAGVVTVTKLAVESYGEYEQLVGGVETLFKDSAGIVQGYAANAYKTAGLSANEYMNTVTSFSASLLQSLGGDTKKAAEYADMAITDMSDNANKFGSTMESIQTAYQGFSKQNYTMLDNLKLGYGGTKTEMERLIKDAEGLDSSFKAARDTNGELAMSYSDIVDAIHIVQTNMDITGTTAKEASTTIQGSVASMKSALRNLVTGLGDTNADISQLLNNLFTSIDTVVGNVEPVIENVLTSITEYLPQALTRAINMVSTLLTNMLPSLINSVSGLIKGIGKALPQMVKGLVSELPSILTQAFENIGDIAGELIPAIAESLGNIVANIPSILVSSVGGLLKGGWNLLKGLGSAIGKQFEGAIDDTIFDGMMRKVETNGSLAFRQAGLNLQKSLATVLGDQDWADAVSELQVAEDILYRVDEEWKAAKEKLSQYTFESAQIDFEVQATTIASLVGVLDGLMDGDGTLQSGMGDAAQQLVEQINGILGSDVLSLQPVEGTLLTKIMQEFDPEATPEQAKEKIRASLLEVFPNMGGDTGESDAEVMYGVVMSIYQSGEYDFNPPLDNADALESAIAERLKANGMDESKAETYAKVFVRNGGIEAFWNTGRSTSASDSGFIQWMVDQGYMPKQDETTITLLTNLVQDYVQGSMTIEELQEQLSTIDTITDEQKEMIVDISVQGREELQGAIEDLEKLTKQKYFNAFSDIVMPEISQNVMDFRDAMSGAAETAVEFNDALNSGNKKNAALEFETLSAQLDTMQGELNANTDLWKDYYTELYKNSDETIRANQTLEEFIQTQMERNGTLSDQSEQLKDARMQMAEYAGQLIDSVGGYENLNEATKQTIALLLDSSSSWNEVTTMMGLNAEQAGSLQGLFEQLTTSGIEPTYEGISKWIDGMSTSQEGMALLSPLLEAFGNDASVLSEFLVSLANNEELAGKKAEEAVPKYEDNQETVSSWADAYYSAKEKFKSASDEIVEKTEETVDAVESEYGNNEVAAKAEETAEGAKGAFDDMPATLESLSDSSLLKMLLKFILYKAILKAAASGIKSDVTDQWTELQTNSQTAGENVVKLLLMPIRNADGRGAGSTLAQAIFSGFNSLSGEWYSLGGYAADGIMSAIHNRVGSAYNAGATLGRAVSSGFRDNLQINSPSKVMYDNMGWVIEGIVESAEENADRVHDAMREITDFDDFGQIETSANVTISAANDSVEEKLDEVIDALHGIGIYIDSDTLVGHTIDKINNGLQKASTRAARSFA